MDGRCNWLAAAESRDEDEEAGKVWGDGWYRERDWEPAVSSGRLITTDNTCIVLAEAILTCQSSSPLHSCMKARTENGTTYSIDCIISASIVFWGRLHRLHNQLLDFLIPHQQ